MLFDHGRWSRATFQNNFWLRKFLLLILGLPIAFALYALGVPEAAVLVVLFVGLVVGAQVIAWRITKPAAADRDEPAE